MVKLRRGADGAAPRVVGISMKIAFPSVSLNSWKAVQPIALNDHVPDRTERMPDGDRCQMPFYQVAHIVFWDWILK